MAERSVDLEVACPLKFMAHPASTPQCMKDAGTPCELLC